MAPPAPAVVGAQRVFTFGKNKTEGNKSMKELVCFTILHLKLFFLSIFFLVFLIIHVSLIV
jgi:hypothetical protein